MLTRIIGLLFFVTAFNSASAQHPDSLANPAHAIKYYNSLLAGCVIGDDGSGTGASVMTYHGIRVKRLAIAAGIGVDDYERWRAMPLQLRVSYDVIRWGESSIFIAGAIGHSQSWRQFDQMTFYSSELRSSGGRTINPCLGIRTGKGKWKFYAEVGYKHQRINWSYTPVYYYMDFVAGGGGTRYTVEEDIDRFHVMIGLGLF